MRSVSRSGWSWAAATAHRRIVRGKTNNRGSARIPVSATFALDDERRPEVGMTPEDVTAAEQGQFRATHGLALWQAVVQAAIKGFHERRRRRVVDIPETDGHVARAGIEECAGDPE